MRDRKIRQRHLAGPGNTIPLQRLPGSPIPSADDSPWPATAGPEPNANRWTLALALILALFASGPADLAAEDKPDKAIPSSITRVHLFDGQALLLRTTAVDLPAGRIRLAFEDLPEKLLDETARLRLKGNSDLRLLDLRVETVVEKEFRTDEARDAEKELKAAEQELREATALYLAQVEQRKALSGIELKPSGDDRPIISIDRWKHIFGFVDNSLTDINARINELLGRIDSARRRLEIALTVADRYRSQKETKRKTVIVDLEASGAGNYELALEYGVEDAGWYPHYRLTLEESRSSTPSVKLATAVYVYNESGESWGNAKLTLSTADLTNPSRLPELQRWTIASVIRPGSDRMARKDEGYAETEADYAVNDVAEAPSSMHRSRESNGPAAEPVQTKKAAPRKALEQQQRMEQSVNEIRGYYEKNLADVKEELADQKAREARDLMDDFRESVNEQENYYYKRDFNNARKHASRTLDIIRRLTPAEKGQFQREIQQAQKIQSWSYEMEQSRKLKQNLTAPGKQVPGDFSMDAPLSVTVASDGVLRSVFISEKRYDASLSYEVSLNRNPGAYLTARIEYNDRQSLLAGPVDIYYGEDYGGTSRHPMVAPSEKYDLNLGKDPDIEIDREDRHYETSEGLFGTQRAVRYEQEFTIKNRRSYGVNMVLYGAVPQSADDRISIKNVKLQPAPEKQEDNGIARFRMNLKPGASEKVIIQYQLIHDRDVIPVMANEGGSR